MRRQPALGEDGYCSLLCKAEKKGELETAGRSNGSSDHSCAVRRLEGPLRRCQSERLGMFDRIFHGSCVPVGWPDGETKARGFWPSVESKLSGATIMALARHT
jgi:hypothetical protein